LTDGAHPCFIYGAYVSARTVPETATNWSETCGDYRKWTMI
jgi:hypothetical protein